MNVFLMTSLNKNDRLTAASAVTKWYQTKTTDSTDTALVYLLGN